MGTVDLLCLKPDIYGEAGLSAGRVEVSGSRSAQLIDNLEKYVAYIFIHG